MREVVDPYKGMKYSDIITLNEDNVRLYRERPHPMIKVPGTGQASWNPWNGRWEV